MSDRLGKTDEEETEGNLVTAFVFASTFGPNLAKALGLTVYHRVFKTGDKRDFTDHLGEFVDRSCKPYATKKSK